MSKEDTGALALSTVCARLRFRQLQLLDILGRTRNLRMTAEQMHMTQPAATKILGDIEAMLGAALFQRLPREMRPTDLGTVALRYASAALSDLNRFVGDFGALRDGGHGHLTVGATSASAAQLLVTCIREVREKRPMLMIRIVEQSSDQLAVWLEEKKIDIMLGRLMEARDRALFDFEPLSGEAVWIVSGPAHPLLARPQLSLAELADWPWILYPQATAIRQLFEECFADLRMQAPPGMVETPSIFSTLELLQATDMLSLQPRVAVEKYIAKGMLCRIPVPVARSMASYGIVTRKNDTLSQPAREFIDVLRKVAKQLPGDADAPDQNG
ncbi:LysR family transcriptional regulator [Noviherbaspirillum sp. 1P10PC]|uniref:LysR family transcriptional regulator n=1 Tax=Noviherbaspirillum sp. 1P10PC TaxID=3132292 RepID=UPI0039A070ED